MGKQHYMCLLDHMGKQHYMCLLLVLYYWTTMSFNLYAILCDLDTLHPIIKKFDKL